MAATPAQLRNMFGANLRTLAAEYPSISELSRKLGINRTQFNRYLAGESFPRPDVLSRICSFFDVDARVLLEPVAQIGRGDDPIDNPFLRDHVAVGARNLPDAVFPSGFYSFSRQSFLNENAFVQGLVYIRRDGKNTFLRGYETKEAMATQHLSPSPQEREFRGIVMQQEDGIAILVSRRNSMTCSFNYLSRVASFQNNFWLGYVSRTVPESIEALRITRLVYEYLGPTSRSAFSAARKTGFCDVDTLPSFHRRLLRTEEAFS